MFRTCSEGFKDCLNHEWKCQSSLGQHLNPNPKKGSVWSGLGLDHGSEPNLPITKLYIITVTIRDWGLI